jgi:hypothetical protein
MIDKEKLAELRVQFPAKELPAVPFIGLFGNHHNNWRNWATELLNEFGLGADRVYDSTDPGWRVVSDGNGDDLQPWVDELVERQHRAMRSAVAIVFSLDSRTRIWPESDCTLDQAIPQVEGVSEGKLFAARCELGWLAGIGKPVFVWIADDLKGRNYLRAVARLYPSIRLTQNLHVACQMAGEHLQRHTSR